MIVGNPSMTTATPAPVPDPTCFDVPWIFGAQIGKDTTANFALSFNGLALKTLDNRWVVPSFEEGRANLIDVTCLIITGIDPYVFRIPVTLEGVEPGDLLVRSDSPFALAFVEEVDVEARRIRGIDPRNDEVVEIVVPEKSLDMPNFLVRIVSLLEGFGGEGLEGREGRELLGGGPDGGLLLPLLLCGGGLGSSLGSSNATANLLLAMALSRGGRDRGHFGLPLLLLCAGGAQSGNALQSLLLASAFTGGRGFGERRKQALPPRGPRKRPEPRRRPRGEEPAGE
jgi:hypothetical protein